MVNGIAWREGLFIRPQHFQQNDRYNEYVGRTMIKESRANSFGFYDLQIDTHFLSAGKFVINRAYGVMDDGSLIDIDTKSHNLVLDIGVADSGKVIYLTLPLDFDRSDRVCFEEDEKETARMITSRMQNLQNCNVDETSSADILVTRYNFKLLKEEEINEGYTSIAIAKIGAVSVSGAITLDSSFSPIYLHSHNSTFLNAQVKELSNIIQFRMVKLSEKLSDVTIQVAELGDYLMLGLLNRYYSRFHFYLSQAAIHPQDMFLDGLSLVAELSIFMKKNKLVLAPIEYKHTEQKESFALLFEELKLMLSVVLEQNSVKLNIEQRKYGIYVARLEDKTLIDSSVFILSVSSNLAPEKLKKMLLDNLKIGTIETIRDLVNYHLAGFKLKALPTAPREIPYRVNHLYFQLEITAEEKKTLHTSGGMALHFATEVENIEYHFWAIRIDNE